ncbi:MAG: CRISPR-associated endonuclease Cas2 [Acidobacteriaceae bacterium]|nr:CRISPR-associated endonuclease Cas2 [Acidobacteriaceae bacterium]
MKGRPLSAYRALWLIAMFDLPVETPANRRDYTRFRKALLKDGFMMLQFSVYARYLPSEEAADAHRNTIRSVIPPLGQVRLITVTDLQFGKMEVYFGKKPRSSEEIPEQILLFE